MNGSGGVGSKVRSLNAVPLQNAVLCAECDVVSDSPHDICMVCGSRSLFNIARVFGGKLPKDRTSLTFHKVVEISSREAALPLSKPHRLRRRATAGSRQLTIMLANHETDEVECGALVEPKTR
jgi:hypothetical protein